PPPPVRTWANGSGSGTSSRESVSFGVGIATPVGPEGSGAGCSFGASGPGLSGLPVSSAAGALLPVPGGKANRAARPTAAPAITMTPSRVSSQTATGDRRRGVGAAGNGGGAAAGAGGPSEVDGASSTTGRARTNAASSSATSAGDWGRAAGSLASI